MVTGNENIQIHIFFVKSGFINIKQRPKWSQTHSAQIVEYISLAKMLHFVSDNM